MEQNCSIPCVDCTLLSPGVRPCPACGGTGHRTVPARMCDLSIQRESGEESRREHAAWRERLAAAPRDPELLKQYREWIRGAVTDSVIYPAWAAGYRDKPFEQEGTALTQEVQDQLRKEYVEAGEVN